MNIPSQIPGTYPKRLTRAGRYLAELLESNGQPVLTHYAYFRMVQKMYKESAGNKLYLRRDYPDEKDCTRLRQSLTATVAIGPDRDYGSQLIRVLSVSDLLADEIVCLADPLCYVSHLSAMQRWGLTNRSSDALICTRPDHITAKSQISTIMSEHADGPAPPKFQLKYINHPKWVRRRAVNMHESKYAGISIEAHGTNVRLATVAQTFLDMLQKPELCGGMSHVLDVYQEHAKTYIDEIVETIDTANGKIVKSRAGYILEEKLDIRHEKIEAWKALGQRGSSRRLDPTKKFAPRFSETWMISLNV